MPQYEELLDSKYVETNLLNRETTDEYMYWKSIDKAITIAPVKLY